MILKISSFLHKTYRSVIVCIQFNSIDALYRNPTFFFGGRGGKWKTSDHVTFANLSHLLHPQDEALGFTAHIINFILRGIVASQPGSCSTICLYVRAALTKHYQFLPEKFSNYKGNVLTYSVPGAPVGP